MIRALVIDMAEKAQIFFERHLPTDIMALHPIEAEGEVEYSTNNFKKLRITEIQTP